MANETIYVVQAYARSGAGLVAEEPVSCKSPEQARKMAEKIAPQKAGVVAFAAPADAKLGKYKSVPTVFFKTGDLPPVFENA